MMEPSKYNKAPLSQSQLARYLDDELRKIEHSLSGIHELAVWATDGDIRKYGARPGKARIAIQNAIDDKGNKGGGIVFIPPGIWTIDGPLNMRSGVMVLGVGYASCIRVENGAAFSDNILKFEMIFGATVARIRVDGNRSNSGGGTRYGIYFGSATDCRVLECYVHSFPGDGIHLYDSDGAICAHNYAWDNFFHGIELEQLRDSVCHGNRSYQNDRHGMFVFQGEVGASGSKGLTVTANACNNNLQSGIVVQGELTEDVTLIGNTCRQNAERGMMFFDRVKGITAVGNIISFNGHFGIYAFRITQAVIAGNRLHNNGQAAHGGFQEILLEGDATQWSQYNTVTDNQILIDGVIKSAYAIKEATVNDGPNVIRNNVVPFPGTAGTIAVLHEGAGGSSFRLCRGNIGRIDEAGGIAVFNGDGASFFFDIAHGLGPDEPRIVSVTPASNDASPVNESVAPVPGAGYYITSDAVNIRIVYRNYVPPPGVGNVAFRWYAAH